MSIINDALQKAGEIKKTNIETPPMGPQGPAGESPVRGRDFLHYKWFYLAGITILLIVSVLVLLPGKKILVKENAVLPKTVISPEPQIVKESPHKAAVDSRLPAAQSGLSDPSEFRLTGIVLGEGAPIAIINDSVYMTGDMIKDLRIAEITKNTVSLEKDGRIIELRVE